MNTRRYPRTMQEAFGPYASSADLQPMPDRRPIPTHEIALYIVSVIAAIVAGVLLLTGR